MSSDDEMGRHLSFFVPSGFVLTKQSEIDRLHNEAEALRIERDSAREENEALHTANELQVGEIQRLREYADGETDKLRNALRELDERA